MIFLGEPDFFRAVTFNDQSRTFHLVVFVGVSVCVLHPVQEHNLERSAFIQQFFKVDDIKLLS